MTGRPSDFPMPTLWGDYACHRRYYRSRPHSEDFGADRTATTTNSICASYPILKHAWINKPITPARPVNRLSDQPNSL
jgi:hypothetical protein